MSKNAAIVRTKKSLVFILPPSVMVGAECTTRPGSPATDPQYRSQKMISSYRLYVPRDPNATIDLILRHRRASGPVVGHAS
jgi:hypothetical protein